MQALRYTVSTLLLLSLWLTAYPSHVADEGKVEAYMMCAEKALKADKSDEAIDWYYHVMDYYREGKRDSLLSAGLEMGGNTLVMNNRYVEALDFYTAAIKVAEKGKQYATYGDCNCNVGTIYALFGDNEHAIYYYTKAYEMARKHENAQLMAVAVTNLVTVYARAGNAAEARRLLKMEMEMPLADHTLHHFQLLFNQGLIALASRDYHVGIHYLSQANDFVTRKQMATPYRIMVLNELGEAHHQLKRDDQALADYAEAARLAHGCNALDQLATTWKRVSEIYRQAGQRDSMAHYQSLYVNLSDSIFNQRQFSIKRNKLFRYENELTEGRISNLTLRVNVLLVAVLVVTLLAFVIIYYNRQLRHAKQLLVARNEDLLRQVDAVRAMGVTHQAAENAETEEETKEEAPQERGEAIDMSRRSELLRAVERVMEDTETISDPQFSMTKLAKLVGSNTTYISAIINETYHKNFKSFLNEYRIREVCRRLTDPAYAHLTISAIASEVGFGNVNNFIIVFKKIMGMTPSTYKKLAANEGKKED